MNSFHKDPKFWTQQDKQQIQKFFMFNSFISKIYERKQFKRIVDIIFYAKIDNDQELILNYNKRPEVIIVLSGQIEIFKKAPPVSPLKRSRSKKKNKLNSPQNQYISIGQFRKQNQVINMLTQAKIKNIGNHKSAEILFIPTSIYNTFIQQKRIEKIESIMQVLSRKFPNGSKKSIKLLSQQECQFCQYRMNSIVYRSGDQPEYAYILLQGNVRIDRPNFSQGKQGLMILSPQTIFGQIEILSNLKIRQNTAVSCGAYTRVLAIPKNPYLKFTEENISLPSIALKMFKKIQRSQNPVRKPNLIPRSCTQKKKQKVQIKLPDLSRFRINPDQSPQQQQEQQYKLIRNSHRLLDAKPKKKSLRSKSALNSYNIDPIKQKIKLFQKIRPQKTKVNLQNRFFDF